MKKIAFIVPHLSTGGLPQYLISKIESLKDIFDIHCLEWSDYGHFRVQKNKLLDIGIPVIECRQNFEVLKNYISLIKPDIIWFEEHYELFDNFNNGCVDWIYSLQSDSCLIYETTHSSLFTLPENRAHYPHKFIFVNDYHINKYKGRILVPMDKWEYNCKPTTTYSKRNKLEAKNKLNFDISKKHILNVGLISPHKNQDYIFNFAKNNPDCVFHFIGNMADNFRNYWEPTLKRRPKNCHFHGELNSNQISLYYEACDLLVHTSTLELNPLVLYEAVSSRLPVLCYKFETYGKKWDDHPLVWYFSGTPLDRNDDDVLKLNCELFKYIINL